MYAEVGGSCAGMRAGPPSQTVNSVMRMVSLSTTCVTVPSTEKARVPAGITNAAVRVPESSVTVLDAARQAEVSDPPNCTVVATGSKATSLTSPTTSYLCATGWIVRNADMTDGAENSSVKSAFPLTARSYQPSARDIVSPNSGCPWTVTAAPNIGRPSPSRTRPRTTETRSGTIKSPFTPVWIGFGPE